MEAQLLRLMLKHEFWSKNKNFFIPEMFPDSIQKIYNLVIQSHDKYKKDLTVDDIRILFYYTYPSTTTAQWELLQKFLNDIPGELSEDVAKEVIQKAYILEQARQITSLGADIINGKEANFQKIGEILKKIDKGSLSDGDELQPVSDELEDILEAISVTTKWSFNVPDLKTVASGMGPGIFCIASARTEVGKTAFGVSLCAGENGFASQGATCHYYCNEESPLRTKGRAVMSYTGMALPEILLKVEETKLIYNEIKDKIKFFDCRGKSIHDIHKHIDKHRPDIVVIDQLDKLSVRGSYAREDERLGSLYVTTRDIGSECSVGIIALSQLSADSEGKTYVSSANLAGARTAKAAEGDLVFGIGKSPAHEDNVRIINIIKNKVSGNHQDVVCMIRPEISRYCS